MELKQRRPRRTISNAEYEEALANPDNVNIIRAVLHRFRDLLDSDARHDCGLRALWRALQYYRPEFGQKFTTSLHRFTLWEARRELRRLMAERSAPLFKGASELADERMAEASRSAEEMEHVQTRLRLLSAGQRRLIEQYYFQGLSLARMSRVNGCSKEKVRQHLGRALRALQKLCWCRL